MDPAYLQALIGVTLDRLEEKWRPAQHEQRRLHGDGGYTMETVLITGLLVVIALAALAIVSTKVLGRANAIDTGGTGAPVPPPGG